MSSEVTILDEDPGHYSIRQWRNVAIVIWESQATLAQTRRLGRASKALTRRHDGKRSTLHFIADGAELPEAEVRKELAQLSRESAGIITCYGIVFSGSAFRVSAIRSMITGMALITSRAYGLKALDSMDQLLGWMPREHEQRTGVKIEADELGRVVRAALPPSMLETLESRPPKTKP